jgi:stage IV sporulation protein B
VETEDGALTPAEDAGIKAGDLICGADGQTVSDAASLIAALENAGEQVELEVKRGSQTLNLPVSTAVGEEGRPMLGILLRDGLNGIGTLTFCDPDSGVFGALGHSINDSETGLAVPLREGNVTQAQIVAVHPGMAGAPGELDGVSDLSQVLGSVEQNTDVGIFGHVSAALGSRPVEISVITAGPASILSTIEGREAQEFQVEVNRVYRDSGGTHAMFSVTDPALLSRTGGIVQGMSGSPILQNGRLVGAVTHVFINDASRGYAVGIQDMLRAAGLAVNKAA